MNDGDTGHIPREIASVTRILADLSCPWAIAGGWALDLYLGMQNRPHKDVDVAVYRRDQLILHSYLTGRGWQLKKAFGGNLILWDPDEFLELPIHCIWCTHDASEMRLIEIVLNECSDAEFLFRREPSVRLPLAAAMIRSRAGIPILAPEIVLLYKAKYASVPPHTEDFERALPHLGDTRRLWLKEALTRLHPGHAWMAALDRQT